MHILIAILGAIAAAFFAFRYFVDAAEQGRDAVKDLRGAYRRGKWSKQIDARLIENLTDPREAAAILLYQIASYDGAVTERQKAAIVSQMRLAFQAEEDTAEGLYAFARMATGEINDAGNSLRKVLAPIIEACTQEEKTSFLAMLKTISEVEGPVSDPQQRLINDAQRILIEAA